MKKFMIAGAIMVVALLVLGAAGFAYAQTQNPPAPDAPYGPGRMGRWNNNSGSGMMGGWGRGMMGRGSGAYGPMHEYMIEAFSEKLGLSAADVQSRLEDGETMWQIAQSTGLTDDEIGDLMLEARTEALEKMVADGVITSEQADWMVERMSQMHANGFGPDSCHGKGGPGRGQGWRWNQQPGGSQ